MRAREDHIRVISGFGPFPPAAFLSPGCPRLPPEVTGGSLCAGARGDAPVADCAESRAAIRPCREALPGSGAGQGCLQGTVTG